MLQAFEHAVLDPHQSDQSISVLSMQLALTHPPLLHSWLACAGLPHAYKDPALRPAFLTHYNEAVKGLAVKLRPDRFAPEEWMQSTILNLHIFEVSKSSVYQLVCLTSPRSIKSPTTSPKLDNHIFAEPI